MQWEYLQMAVEYPKVELLNSFGLNRWELVAVVQSHMGDGLPFTLYMKRPLLAPDISEDDEGRYVRLQGVDPYQESSDASTPYNPTLGTMP